jgi:hypothetical protein
MFVILHMTLSLLATNTMGVAKSAARLPDATESTAAGAEIARTIGELL